MITLQFCGGARSVTGGNYLVDNGRVKFLLECGMAQGSQEAEQSNYEPFAYEPSVIDFLIVTHAHIDHMGRVPKLVKDGFDAPIYSTPPTKDISRIALEDSVSVMKNEKTETPLLFDMEDVNAGLGHRSRRRAQEKNCAFRRYGKYSFGAFEPVRVH
ncbi:MAG: hypothetical protein BRC23_01000 [Parcubacteria group bacterium SW_4_49_11]|nr:MAG: hypothetical protein BRC23_01000 [Parcubacteria group bacterium SW_4_49_11]